MTLEELKVGDRIKGFEGFGCIPDNAVRAVKKDAEGHLYVSCSSGNHYLDGQIVLDEKTGRYELIGLSIVE
jgi:hypothetical protein